MRATWAILVKDLRVEFRTRTAFTSILVFALVTLVVVSLTAGPSLVPSGSNNLGQSAIASSALLWVILLFAGMSGLARTFVYEEEVGTALALRLSAPPLAVFSGKLLFNLFLLLLLSLVVIPLYLLLIGLPIRLTGLFLLLWGTGVAGLAGTTTFLAALVARAHTKGALLSILAFPLLMPLLLALVRGTQITLLGSDIIEGIAYLKASLGYAGAMTTIGFLLFPVVWKEG